MPKSKRVKKRLSVADFAGDGEPYSEVTVTISIRVLGAGIARSRLAVNVCPDPALEQHARKSLRALKKENYGIGDNGVFGACLCENFNGWEDLENDYPRIDESGRDSQEEESLKAMNAYLRESVEWALMLNKQGMEEATRKTAGPGDKHLLM